MLFFVAKIAVFVYSLYQKIFHLQYINIWPYLTRETRASRIIDTRCVHRYQTRIIDDLYTLCQYLTIAHRLFTTPDTIAVLCQISGCNVWPAYTDAGETSFQRQRLLATCINPLTAKWFNLNFHPLEVVSRWHDPQLQVSKNYSYLTKWRSTVFKYC